MVSIKGLNNDIRLGRLITVRPLCYDYLVWLGCFHCHLHLPVLSDPGYCTCIYKLANKYKYNGTDRLQCGRKYKFLSYKLGVC